MIALFEKHRADVRWVSETAQLDQEEALAYLLADLLDYELLPDEARTIGWAVRGAAKAFKGKPKRKPGAAKPKPSADQKLVRAAEAGPRMRVDESEIPHNQGPSCETSPRRCIGCNMDGRCYSYYGRQSQWLV